MAANVLRSILLLLLTGGAYWIGLLFRDWPNASALPTFKIIWYVLSAVMLFLACWQWRKIGGFTKRAWMAENPAPCNPDMIDCYVRFEGKVAKERLCRLPLSGRECAFYMAAVAAEWQVKKKKPGKGMETARKPLLRDQSSEELELKDRNRRVYVKAGEFTKSCLGLRTQETSQAQCPSAVQDKAASKYKTYHVTEHFLLHEDMVTAQGRLTRSKDGRLFITPTGRLEFPSFLVLKTQKGQFVGDLAGKARSDAWGKRLYVAALILNAGLFIYLWQ